MAIPNGYGNNIRQSLVGNGINNDDIGFNKSNGYVTVKGQDFMKPSKVLDGVSYDTQSSFNNAWNSYQKSQQPKQPAPSNTVPNGFIQTRDGLGSYGIGNDRIGYNNGNVMVDNRAFGQPTLNQNGTSYYLPSAMQNDYTNFQRNSMTNDLMNYKMPENPYNQQISDQLNYLMNYAKNQQPIDPYSTSEYAARQAQAQRSASQGIRASQEALGSSGFGRSTMLSERAQGIQNDANEYLETQVLPQIIANEQARRQQEYSNLFNLLQPMMNQQAYADQRSQTERGNIMDTLGYLNGEDQRSFQNAVTQGQLTGNYMPPQAQEIVNQILQLKQAAESPGVTAQQRSQLSGQADQLRSKLDAMGVNSNLIGSNINYNTAKGTQIGIPTLENKQFNEKMAYQTARDAISDKQWQQKFDQDAQQFGLNYALSQLNQQNDQAYRQAQLALSQDDNARQWVQLENQMYGRVDKYSGMSASQVLNSLKDQFENKGLDITQPEGKDTVYRSVVEYDLPEDQEKQVMLSLGLTAKDIKDLDKKYPPLSGK